MDRTSGFRAWRAALVLLLAGVLWLQFGHIGQTLPYPGDTDEGFVSHPALRTLTTGTFHPETFNYPSLPKYLASAAMAVGFIQAATHLELREIRQVGNLAYPYYDTPRVMKIPRELFALLSVIALAATGAAAWHAFRSPPMILLAPLLVVTTPLFFYHSWTYLNVDIVGLCFSTLTLSATLRGTRAPSMARSAIVPGLLAGLAVASKYTQVVVIVPVLLAIVFFAPRGRRLAQCATAIALMMAGFLAATPYSVIDIPGFLDGVAFEAFHYARGHVGWEGDPGLPQLLYYGRHFLGEFGPVALAAAALGVVLSTASDWRRSAVLLSFPFATLWLLATQRVHFPRNVLSLYPILGILAAYGIVAVHGFIVRTAAGREWRWMPSTRLGIVAGLLLVGVAVPWWHVPDEVRDRTDSRKLAADWIKERIPKDWTVVVPTELRFDLRPLQDAGVRVTTLDLRGGEDSSALQRLLSGVERPAVVLAPKWGADERYPGQDVANRLNSASAYLQVLKTFGTNPVLVNYAEFAPWGDPGFSVTTVAAH